jgi:hypothetical protein
MAMSQGTNSASNSSSRGEGMRTQGNVESSSSRVGVVGPLVVVGVVVGVGTVQVGRVVEGPGAMIGTKSRARRPLKLKRISLLRNRRRSKRRRRW